MNKFLFLFFFATFYTNLFSTGTQYLMPIINDMETGKGINICVTIPEGFKQVESLQSSHLDFIPEGEESKDRSSQWISLQIFPQCRVCASTLANAVRQIIFKFSLNPKFHEQFDENNEGYSASSFMIEYNKNNRQQLLSARIYSGPDYCSIFYYVEIIHEPLTLPKLKEIKEFVDQQISIVRF